MDALHQHILQIMSSQSPGYLIEPQAAAFMAAGLDDAEAVDTALHEMSEKGLVEFITEETDFEVESYVEKEDSEGDYEQVIEKVTHMTDWGWALTPKGKKAI